MKKMFTVIYRDDTNNQNEVLGSFNRIENAKICLQKKYDEVKKNLGDSFTSDTKEDTYWGINYEDSYYDVCEIFQTEYPND